MAKASNKAANKAIIATAAAVGEFRFPKAADFAPKAVDKVETIVAVAHAAKVETVALITKTSIANPILAQMFALPEAERPARKDMIAAIRTAAGLTPAGAATYLQNFKSKYGHTKPRVAATA